MKNLLGTYQAWLIELEKINMAIEPLYSESTNLYSHKIGVYKIFQKILLNIRFMYETSDISPQQMSLTITRTIVDHYAIFYLLSCYSTRKEQGLRYYLYIIDSLNIRIKTINEFSSKAKNVPDNIIEGNKQSNLHDQDAINKIFRCIKEQELDLLVDQKVINNYNWKFVANYPAQNKNMYSWQELYNIARIPKHFSKSIQNHFSSFTHGLGMAILYDEKPELRISAYEFVAILQTLIGKAMLLNFPPELNDLILRNDFLELGEEGWNNWHLY